MNTCLAFRRRVSVLLVLLLCMPAFCALADTAEYLAYSVRENGLAAQSFAKGCGDSGIVFAGE